MPDFIVKLPVFQLSATTRGVVLGAKIIGTGAEGAEVTMLCDDGKTIVVAMTAARVMQAAQHGPYVVFAEVKDTGGQQLRTGLVGPDGTPL